MPHTSLNKLMQALGHNFNDSKILELALTHRSKSLVHNERLEFLGDAVLDLVLSNLLYCKFPDAAEGVLTTARAKLVCAEFLQKIAKDLDLVAYVNFGHSHDVDGISPSILSDAMEAVFGAVYLDAGYTVCDQVISNIYAAHLDAFDITANIKDFKTTLQEFTQKNAYQLPVYTIEKITGAAHQQVFTIKCSINALDLSAVASGDSKRKTEQLCAEKMLKLLSDKDYD